MIGKNELLAILEDWNFWHRDLNSGIRRDFYLEKLLKSLKSEKVVVITGVRRSGKSFLMRQLAKELVAQGAKKEEILMINFEDPRFESLDARLLQNIFETYLENLSPAARPYIFLDEIQEVKNWEKWVRMMQELNKGKIILSGSNSQLLSQELATLLTGRHQDFTIFPLSFKEFLAFKEKSYPNGLTVKNSLNQYLETGGFPEIVLGKEEKENLLIYFDDILSKDLIKRFKIRKGEKLKNLTRYYLSNVSTLITYSSLEKNLGVSADTIEKFSAYLQTGYLTFFVKRFSFKVKEQEKSPRKVYAIDTGLAKAVGFSFSQDLGRMAENAVFLELIRKKTVNPQLEVFYWKDQQHHEVDFVIKEGLNISQGIQVCWDLTQPTTKDREVKNLIRSQRELNLPETLVITGDYEGKEKIAGRIIKFIPLWKWLSEN